MIRDYYLSFTNDCLRLGSFPKRWKHAEVVKGSHIKGNPTLPKSYRLISLLSTFAKAVERIICYRIESETVNQVSGLQYGFVPGRSAETAIRNLLNWQSTPWFLDITGAFDNLQWKVIVMDIEALGC